MSYNAEVRAVRAMAYMYLLDMFGRVPIVTKITMPVHDIYQSERSEVFDFAWDEMQMALLYLPDERSNSRGEYYGRVTKPVVHFMLMKMALNAEVWRDDDWTDEVRPDGKTIQLPCGEAGEKNAWEAVNFYGQQILSSQAGYVLCESQLNCFSTYNEDATENIFTIPMDPNVYRNRFKNLFRSLHYQHAAALGYGGENGSCATQETLDVFGYGTNHPDCRFPTTFFSGIVHVRGNPLVLSSGDTLVYYPREVQMNLTGSPYVATAGARMSKYAHDPGTIFDGQLRNSDIVLFRLADVEPVPEDDLGGFDPFFIGRQGKQLPDRFPFPRINRDASIRIPLFHTVEYFSGRMRGQPGGIVRPLKRTDEGKLSRIAVKADMIKTVLSFNIDLQIIF